MKANLATNHIHWQPSRYVNVHNRASLEEESELAFRQKCIRWAKTKRKATREHLLSPENPKPPPLPQILLNSSPLSSFVCFFSSSFSVLLYEYWVPDLLHSFHLHYRRADVPPLCQSPLPRMGCTRRRSFWSPAADLLYPWSFGSLYLKPFCCIKNFRPKSVLQNTLSLTLFVIQSLKGTLATFNPWRGLLHI